MHPYGNEITSTGNDREKFGTYTRDAYTGLDYADQRYYASTYGRFNTVDPDGASAKPGDPVSWNRYAYTRGDPVNRIDPRGMDDCDLMETAFFGCPDDDGEASDPSGVGPVYYGACANIAVSAALPSGINCITFGSSVIPVAAPSKAATNRQLNDQCKANVRRAAATVLQGIEKDVAGIKTLNDAVTLVSGLAVSSSAGYMAAT